MSKIPIQKILTKLEYSVTSYLRFCIYRTEKGWVLAEDIMGPSAVVLMSGKKVQCQFKTLSAAQRMLQKVVDDYTSELTPAEIDSHYTDAWIKKEEQSVELSKFKKALIAKDWATARSTYETFSNWTLEAMHAKVVLQLQNSLNTKKSKASL